MTNAERFIAAYNKIDSLLRSIYGVDVRVSFTEVVRRTAKKSSVIAACEYKLIDYARLRNAIVHQGTREEIIAEPHTDVVEDFENIAALIASPPNAYERVAKKKVLTLSGDVTIKEAIRAMYESGYSNVPVTKAGRLIGVLNNKLIVDTLARSAARGENIDIFASEHRISGILLESMEGVYYAILPRSASVTDILDLFNSNRKMLCALITENGNGREKPIGIITSADIWELNDIIDNYNI